MRSFRAAMFAGLGLTAVLVRAQNAPAPTPVLNLVAVTANVAGAPDNIRINLLRWSTDAEREKLMAAWNMTAPAGRAGGGGRSGGRGPSAGRGARAGGRSGRGAAPDPAADTTPDPDAGDDPNIGFAARYRVEEAPPATPETSLAAALKQTPSLGYLWSSEVAGYAIRYAGKVAGADGNDRIILITDRRLGKTNSRWKPAGAGTPSAYDFSVIELRLNAKSEGEGKISLLGKIMPDSAAKIVALEDYGALPAMLTNVKPKQR
jgi:hypothetical protein